jgi:hypothetical protein
MTDQEQYQTEILFTESPASWNTRYITPGGFICQITLRDEVGMRLLKKAQAAIQDLIEDGCVPYPTNNANGQVTKDPRAYCPIHQCEMKKWSKNGKSWSHESKTYR